jgi:peptidoglycan/LPS O-acetylase OafA/YrhL
MTAQRNVGLDAVRGLCACVVAFYHFCAWTDPAFKSLLAHFAVCAFFVLSALTLSIVYAPRFSGGIAADAVLQYVRNRAARILPLLALAALANAVLDIAMRHRSVTESLVKLVFTGGGAFAAATPQLYSNTAGAWSLGIEIGFYAVFPVLLILATRAKPTTLMIATLCLLGLQYLHGLLTAGLPDQVLYTVPIAFGFYFAAGLLINRVKLADRAVFLPAGLLLLGAALAWSFTFDSWRDVTASVGAGLLVPLALAGAIWLLRSAPVPPVLAWPAEILGQGSYSIYLLHPFAFLAVERAVHHFGWPRAAAAVLFAAATLALSQISFHLIETPLRNLLRGDRAGRGPGLSVRTQTETSA